MEKESNYQKEAESGKTFCLVKMLIDSEILIRKLKKESQETTTNAKESKIETRKFLFLEDIVRIIKSCTGT